MKLMAFIGKMQAGKDTCAEYLMEKKDVKIIKFADPLYACQSAVYLALDLVGDNCSEMRMNKDQCRFFSNTFSEGEDPYLRAAKTIYYICRLSPSFAEEDDLLINFLKSDWEGKGVNPNKDRKLLQFLGTEWGRKTIDNDLWVDLMEERLARLSTNDLTCICTDCRFPNEWDVLKKFGCDFYKVVRLERERVASGATNLTHESETSLDHIPDNEYKKVFYNYSTLQDLYGALNEEFSTL